MPCQAASGGRGRGRNVTQATRRAAAHRPAVSASAIREDTRHAQFCDGTYDKGVLLRIFCCFRARAKQSTSSLERTSYNTLTVTLQKSGNGGSMNLGGFPLSAGVCIFTVPAVADRALRCRSVTTLVTYDTAPRQQSRRRAGPAFMAQVVDSRRRKARHCRHRYPEQFPLLVMKPISPKLRRRRRKQSLAGTAGPGRAKANAERDAPADITRPSGAGEYAAHARRPETRSAPARFYP